MALRNKINLSEVFLNVEDEDIIKILNNTDEFMFFDIESRKSVIDLRDAQSGNINLYLNINMGECYVIVNQNTGVKIDMEENLATVINDSQEQDNQEITLNLFGENNFSKLVVAEI